MSDGNDERLEGMRIVRHKPGLSRKGGFSKRTLWAVTMAKLYMKYLRTRHEPSYPKEPADSLPRV